MEDLIKKLNERVSLLDKLKEDTERGWGLMTPQHMIEHLGGIFYMTSKGVGMPEGLPPEKAVKAKARFFNSFLPFDKSVPLPGAAAKVQKLRYGGLEEAKTKTKAAIQAFIEATINDPDKEINHSYFGPMKMSEWLNFHRLHMEHHLMQFGILHRDDKIKEIEKLIYKISAKISSDTTAQWGKMNAHQMIEHLGITFLFSTGKFKMPYTGTAEEAAKNWQGFLDSDDPWKDVFPNINIGEPRPPRRETIEESKADLAGAFVKYMNYTNANPEAKHPQLAMGDLDVDQWRQVHVKHLKHHARQFGLEL